MYIIPTHVNVRLQPDCTFLRTAVNSATDLLPIFAELEHLVATMPFKHSTSLTKMFQITYFEL